MISYRRLRDVRAGKETVLWRGQHPNSASYVTVKEPAEVPKADRARVLNKLQREFRFLESLRHPHILKPTQWDDASGRILFEDVQGTVAQLLARFGRLEVDRVALVMAQCLKALAHLHERKLAHGSLCTHTLLVSPECDVKFGDFVGYRYDARQPLTLPEYTLKYQAPELLDDARREEAGPPELAAVRADLYSLGYTALEMLAGPGFDRIFWGGDDAPVDEHTNWLCWHADMARALPPLDQLLPDVPRSMLDVLTGLVPKAPRQRIYKSAGEVLAALDRARLTSTRKLPPLDAGPVRAEPPPPPPEERPRKRTPATGASPGTVELWRPRSSSASARLTPPGPVLVGRDPHCDLKLNSPEASEKHALFVCQESGAWWVYDLASRTGVTVNGQAVSARRLEDGDKLRLGGASFDVRVGAGKPRRRLGEFELVRRLHKGANGDLYLAQWVAQGDRDAAVRVFPPEFQFDREAIERFLRGIPRGGEMRHPHFVRLYRGGFRGNEETRTWYLAMEYLPGGSLRDRLAKRGEPLPVSEVIRFARDICNALEEASARSLVHRNINPACILFAADGTAKLGDFFLMRSQVIETLQQITQAGVAPGEYVYQPPEQVRGDRELTPACDLYSLAACMYEALTLRPPVNPKQGLKQMLEQIAREPLPSPRQLNPAVLPALERLLVRALAKTPEERPQSPEEMRKALSGLK